MARITASDVSNFDESKELAVLTQQGRPVHWPPVHKVSASEPDSRGPAEPLRKEAAEEEEAADDEEDDPSAGTNSSTSGSKPELSGSQPQGTQASRQVPAPDAGNLSGPGQPTRPQPSTAPSTSGSGQGTGSDPARPSGSSAESAPASPATRATGEEDPGTGGFAVSGPVE